MHKSSASFRKMQLHFRLLLLVGNYHLLGQWNLISFFSLEIFKNVALKSLVLKFIQSLCLGNHKDCSTCCCAGHYKAVIQYNTICKQSISYWTKLLLLFRNYHLLGQWNLISHFSSEIFWKPDAGGHLLFIKFLMHNTFRCLMLNSAMVPPKV